MTLIPISQLDKKDSKKNIIPIDELRSDSPMFGGGKTRGSGISASWNPDENVGDMAKSIFGENFKKTMDDPVISTATRTLNSAALGLPRQIMRKYTPDAEKAVFPEPDSLGEMAANTAGDIGGFIIGAAPKIGAKVIGKMAGPTVIKEAAKYGIAGAIQTPQEEDGAIVNIPGRATNAAISAVAVPASAVVGRVISRGGKGIVNLSKSLRKYGDDLADSGFIRNRLAPKVTEAFNKAKESFAPSFRKFAVDKAKVSKDSVEHISRRGMDRVSKTMKATGGDLGKVAAAVDDAFNMKTERINELYNNALKNVPDGENVINVNKTYSAIKKILKENGWLDMSGNLTARATDPVIAPTQSPTLRALAAEYKILNPTKSLPGTGAKSTVGKFTTQQWLNLKNGLTNLYKKDQNQKKSVKRILDVMHSEAEKSGLEGIKEARKAFTEHLKYSDMEGKITDKFLSNISKLDNKKSKALKDFQRYLGVDFESPSKDIVSMMDLDNRLSALKIGDTNFGSTEFFARNLERGLNKTESTSVKNSLGELLGDKKFTNNIFNDLKAFDLLQKSKKTAGIAAKTAAGVAAARILGKPLWDKAFE